MSFIFMSMNPFNLLKTIKYDIMVINIKYTSYRSEAVLIPEALNRGLHNIPAVLRSYSYCEGKCSPQAEREMALGQ